MHELYCQWITHEKWEEEKEILCNFQYMNARGAYWIFKRMKEISIKFNLPHTCYIRYGKNSQSYLFQNNPIFLILLKTSRTVYVWEVRHGSNNNLYFFNRLSLKYHSQFHFVIIFFISTTEANNFSTRFANFMKYWV